MSDPNFVILYVDNVPASAAFYGGLLGRDPLESSATFAMFALASGVMLGLWSRETVEPVATTSGGGSEIAFAVDGPAVVDAMHQRWYAQGLPIAQAPVAMDFGYTFVALDPDRHRLRVFAPNPA